ncbi:hypothetical protein K2173_000776 [Erythroxylum novogranatense]|uniref:Uncharacterized protein n=1 Tax=Erythroxylum novogranatense TaxID=1862640 RepID=A0AAV8T2W1_9ROSI|nr:hypothetical protein K2173_000776 [Erythroxylum novogranatense]
MASSSSSPIPRSPQPLVPSSSSIFRSPSQSPHKPLPSPSENSNPNAPFFVPSPRPPPPNSSLPLSVHSPSIRPTPETAVSPHPPQKTPPPVPPRSWKSVVEDGTRVLSATKELFFFPSEIKENQVYVIPPRELAQRGASQFRTALVGFYPVVHRALDSVEAQQVTEVSPELNSPLRVPSVHSSDSLCGVAEVPAHQAGDLPGSTDGLSLAPPKKPLKDPVEGLLQQSSVEWGAIYFGSGSNRYTSLFFF